MDMSPKRKCLLALTALALASLLVGCGNGAGTGENVPLTFIEFYDPACPFCQQMEATVEDLDAEYSARFDDWKIVNVTTDEGREQVEEFGVFLTPTFVILDEAGEELDRVTGATTKENMVAFVERAIADALGEDAGPRDVIEGEGSTIGDEPEE